MTESPLLQTRLIEVAQQLTELQRRILQALKDKGPGLLLEVAVRVLKFPEDVFEPLRELQLNSLVETQTVRGGQFGSELYSLTPDGERVVRLLNDPAFIREIKIAAPSAPDPRRQEVELLNKLGDVAKEKGELDKAVEYYQQALSIARDLGVEGSGK